MGMPTGFKEFERVTETYEKSTTRVMHYHEFVPHLNDAQAKAADRRRIPDA